MGFPIIGAVENGSDDDASCIHIIRLHDLNVLHLCVSAIGEPCITPSSRGLQAERLPPEASASRSHTLGLAIASLARLARCSGVCSAPYRHCLAEEAVSGSRRIGILKHILRGVHPSPAPGTHPARDLSCRDFLGMVNFSSFLSNRRSAAVSPQQVRLEV
jgi:hypothetical protein